MGEALRVLLIEDEADDAELVLLELRRGGFEPSWERVSGADALRRALAARTWDVVLSDYVMPELDGLRALELVVERGDDVPFILVSGEIGDELAVSLMKAGCADYVPKGNLARLAPAIRRELREAEVRRQKREAQEALRFLSDASAEFVSSLDYEETVRAAARHAVPHLADWCVLDVLDDDGRVRRLGLAHVDPAKEGLLAELARRYPARPGSASPPSAVMRTGRPVLLPTISDEQLRSYVQDLEHLELVRGLGISSVLVVPLAARGRTIGALSLVSAGRRYGAADLATAEDFARRAALALENARLFRSAHAAAEAARAALEGEQRARAQAEAARRRAAFLAEASHVLSLSLDYGATLDRVVHLPVPGLADLCAVVVPGGARLGLAALASSSPDRELRARELLLDLPADAEAGAFACEVIRSGRPLLVAAIPDAPSEAAPLRHVEALARRLELRSFFSVPVSSRGRSLGALAFGSARPDRRYDEQDVALGQELGQRIGAAIDNALLYRDAQDAIRVRDEFLSVASHELRTPLTTLKLQIAGLSGASDPRRVGAALASMNRQVDRLALLIHNLLEVSRLGAGRFTIECGEMDLAELARDVAARFDEQLARAGCELRLAAEEPARGSWDRSLLDQVLTNLISNAIKFGAGAPIDVEVEPRAGSARLTVRDRGIGIASEDVRRIFGRFERAVSARHYGGLGLGLFVSRQIVEAHGGRIAVESRAGEGSTFTVELPRRAPSCDEASWTG